MIDYELLEDFLAEAEDTSATQVAAEWGDDALCAVANVLEGDADRWEGGVPALRAIDRELNDRAAADMEAHQERIYASSYGLGL